MTTRIELDPDRNPWDPQPGETDRACTAFLTYRGLPAGLRSLRAAAETFYCGDESTGGERQMSRWSSENRWVERVTAWDRWEAQQIAAATRDALVAMRTRHAQIASVALSKVVDRLQTIDSGDMTVRDMTHLLDVAVKVERLSRGESSATVDVGAQVPLIDREPATQETLEQFIAALAEAGVISVDD